MSRQYPDTSHIPVKRIKSTFAAEGALCAATLHLPPQASEDAPLPAILMVGGWGSVQMALTSSFVHRFVEAGCAVMEFDHPGWGDSSGFPRQGINPWRRRRVTDVALAHLKAQPWVQAERIVLWGTSFGGGHVVDVASQHRELAGAIIQVPMLDGMAASLATPPLRLMQFTALALFDTVKPGLPCFIPTLAPPGGFGTMDRDGAWEALNMALAEWPNRRYDNRVAARSTLTMPWYRPWKRLAQVDVPMLIIGARGDTVAPFVSDKIASVGNPKLEVVEIDGNHFDPYFEPVFPGVCDLQLRFLQRLLKPA